MGLTLLAEQSRLNVREHLFLCQLKEVLFNLEAIRTTIDLCGCSQCRATSGTRVNHHVVLVGEDADEFFEQGDRLLRGMNLWRTDLTRPLEAVEYHAPFVVELRQLVLVEHQAIFAVAHNLHVRFQHLCAVVFTEHQGDVVHEAVTLPQFDVVVQLLESAEEHHEHAKVTEPAEATSEHHHHEEIENDEHIWLSLKNAEMLVKALAESIAKLDTAHAAEYHMKAALYIAKISALDAQYRATMENATLKTILFGDRFPFRYLVDDYGIKYYAAFVGCSAESEASFETITFLAGKMDSLALPAIFTIDGSDGKIARAILDASKNSKNAEVLMLNSMQSVKDEQIKAGADYLSIMRDNLEVLRKAIK